MAVVVVPPEASSPWSAPLPSNMSVLWLWAMLEVGVAPNANAWAGIPNPLPPQTLQPSMSSYFSTNRPRLPESP